MNTTDTVRLTIRPLPDKTPAALRYRSMLKAMLRQYGFRCLAVEWLNADGTVMGSLGNPCPPPRKPSPKTAKARGMNTGLYVDLTRNAG